MGLKFGTLAVVGGRLFLGLIFFTGGMSKLIPFPGVMGPVWLEDALQAYGLGLYAQFIAWSEAFIGLLLFSRRFATLGAIMMVPLLINIFVVTVSLGWRGTPYVVGLFLLVNAYLLIYDSRRLKILIADPGARALREFGPWRADIVALAGIGCCLLGVPLHALDPVVGYTAIGCGLAALILAPIWRRRTLIASRV